MADAEEGSSGPQLAPTAVTGSARLVRDEDDVERYGLRFQTQRKLASGGMASILHAYDPLLGRHVAIKLLHSSLVQQRGEVDAFLREARLTAQLEHPNIVPVYDIASGPASEWACFAMKLVTGSTLAERFEQLGERRLAATELPLLLEVLLKICDALSYAHSRRVLHLDLKPHNIMIGDHGQVYLMDWGIAVRCVHNEHGRLAPVDHHGSVRGTLAYMAPEQLDRELANVDERADVYGLGAILYQLLTGRTPFTALGGLDDHDRLRAHVVEEPHELADKLRIPPALVRVTMRALAKAPSDRYPTVTALREDLQPLARGGGWFHARDFEAGTLIVREGEQAQEAYIVIAGECEVEQKSGQGAVSLRHMRAGDVFGELAIFTRGARTATVRALTRVSVLVVTRETLDWELGSLGWLGGFVDALANRFREADDQRVAERSEPQSSGA